MSDCAYLWFDTEFTSLDVGRASLLQVSVVATSRELARIMPPDEDLNLYLQIDPGDIHKVIDALEGDYDLVAGWRVPRVDPWTNRLQSWLYNRLMSSMTGVQLHDLNCGLTGMRRKVIEEVEIINRCSEQESHENRLKAGTRRQRLRRRQPGKASCAGWAHCPQTATRRDYAR